MWQPDRKQWVVIWVTFVIAGMVWLGDASFSEESNRRIILMLAAATLMILYFRRERKP